MTAKRVLIIEDEYLVAVELQWELERSGFIEVEHAATEQEALESLHAQSWDAVVADANLNGRGITRILTALQSRRIPFVIVTGYGRESLPPDVGGAPILEKPFSGPRLVQIVATLCSKPSDAGPLQARAAGQA